MYFERSGGFAGLKISIDIKTDELVQDEREKLDLLIQESEILNFKPKEEDRVKFPDQFEYLFRISGEGINVHITLDHGNIPDSFKSLIEYLMELARLQKVQNES